MKKKNSKKRQKQQIILFGSIGAVVLIATVIVCVVIINSIGGSGSSSVQNPDGSAPPVSITTNAPVQDDKQAQASAILQRLTMLEGTKIQGIDVSNMTKEQAKAALQANEAQLVSNYSIIVSINEQKRTLGSENVIVVPDYDKSVEEAFSLVRTDNGADSVIAEAEAIRTNGRDVPLSFLPDETSVRAYVAGLATEVDNPAVNATVVTDPDSNKISYKDEEFGTGIDQERLVTDILSASNMSSVEAHMIELAPSLTKAMLEEQYVLRVSFTTSYSGSTSNRKFNIAKGADMMNGTILRPDEVFSCNDKLGVRTSANGWKLAGAYVQGNVDEQAGGGVCQLSSTLYNAVVLGDLEIVSRRNHSMPVSYVDRGRDATINSVGNIIDFTFKNNTGSDIIIICYTANNKVTFELYGVPLKNDEYDEIRIRTEKISTQEIVEEITEDPKHDVGYEEITQEGTKGYVYKAYKQYYKNGKMVREELLNTSTYKMYPTKKIVGIKPTPEPSPSPDASTPPPIINPDPTTTPDPNVTPNIPVITDP